MSFLAWLRKALSFRDSTFPPAAQAGAQAPPATNDSLAAVQELSRLFTQGKAPALDAGSEEVSLALGTLFREQGDIDQAVRLREMLLTRAGNEPPIKARASFELGRDYRKAGLLDRALSAYKDALRFGHSAVAVSRELAQLYADSGDFAAAAAEAALFKDARAQACYLVWQAEEDAAAGRDEAAFKLLRQALHIYPGSPEARLALASMSLLEDNAEAALEQLRAGLANSSPSGRLLLLEGLYAFAGGRAAPDIAPAALRDVALGLSAALDPLEPDVTLCYYAGLYLQLVRLEAEAEQWFTKALVLDPEFWAARLALLALAAGREPLPSLLEQQVHFFTTLGSHSKRFFCPPCGMRRDTIFSQCPRCLAWHSAAFRTRLN